MASSARKPHRRPVGLRIVGGELRGRRLRYSGRADLRPMKDRVREALFNRLAGAVTDKFVLDLFAGTGAVAIEAISRGASQALLVEVHPPTAELIRRNLTQLNLQDRCRVVVADVFRWIMQADLPKEKAWLVICCPPYEFYHKRLADMIRLLEKLLAEAPAESVFVVEADEKFDFQQLPRAADWDVRLYRPAKVGILYC